MTPWKSFQSSHRWVDTLNVPVCTYRRTHHLMNRLKEKTQTISSPPPHSPVCLLCCDNNTNELLKYSLEYYLTSGARLSWPPVFLSPSLRPRLCWTSPPAPTAAADATEGKLNIRSSNHHCGWNGEEPGLGPGPLMYKHSELKVSDGDVINRCVFQFLY